MREFIKHQIPNLFLWTPLIMAMGAGAYFTCGNAVMCALLILAGTVCILGILRRWRPVWIGGTLFIFGAAYAAAYTHIIATPQLYHDIRNAEITGRVTAIEHTPDKTRAFIKLDSTQVRTNSRRPATVRVNIPTDSDIHIGDDVRATVSLFPPAGSDAPATFDYARWAYFNRLSATGFADKITPMHRGRTCSVDTVRDYIHGKAMSPLADALVLGYKNTLTDTERDIWTRAGVGHIWSISGFHITLVAGWLFAIFFMIFRSVPFITRRIPARFPATICAWCGIAIYLMLSGAGVATIRAFLMTSLVFLATLLGRSALSMRNIAIAFCVVFLINPHYVMQAGFQLSFSAVFGLIWFWNAHDSGPRHTIGGKIRFAIYAAVMTSVVATIFTAPFIAAHFYAMPMYSLIGNLVLVPIFSFIIMPLVMVGTLGACVGWGAPLQLAAAAYDIAFRVAQHIAAMPYANIITPHIPNSAMIMFILALGTVMLIKPMEYSKHWIFRRVNYVLCVVLVVCGVILTAVRPRGAFFVTSDHTLAGMMIDGDMQFNKARASNHKFTFNTWRQFNNLPMADENVRHKCNDGVCIYKSEKFTVAYILKFVPLQKNIGRLCRDDEIDYIISYFDIRAPKCDNKILRGGVIIYPSGRVSRIPRMRPWHNPRA